MLKLTYIYQVYVMRVWGILYIYVGPKKNVLMTAASTQQYVFAGSGAEVYVRMLNYMTYEFDHNPMAQNAGGSQLFHCLLASLNGR